MNKLQKLLLSFVLAPAALLAQYSYIYTDNFSSLNTTTIWAEYGTVYPTSAGLTGPGGGGTIVYYGTLGSTPTGEYEVATTITLGSGCTSSCGTYVNYLNVSGNYYSVELQNPHWSGGVCSANLVMNKYYSSTLTTLTSSTISCHSGMVIRAVHTFSGQLVAYVDGVFTLWAQDFTLSTGLPGIGAYGTISGDSIAQGAIGELDTVAPSAFNSSLIGTSSFSNRVDFQSPGVTDNTYGTGVLFYRFLRGPTSTSLTPMDFTNGPAWSDTTVAAGTTYYYQILAYDFHLNVSSSSVFEVVTPASGSIDPRRVGVRPTGAYWGASPEQIDVLSGNLSYSLPLLKAQGRNGWGVGFSLSYNSQNWRKDSGGTWDLGRDVGYGYGWKLLAGSLTPYWAGYWTIDHYTFTDATGAEYRLTNNSGGIWTSTESIYLSYDSNAGILHFPDGSFWVMGSISTGSEPDAGTAYPTVMEDTNGTKLS